jgi:hypothetical protein
VLLHAAKAVFECATSGVKSTYVDPVFVRKITPEAAWWEDQCANHDSCQKVATQSCELAARARYEVRKPPAESTEEAKYAPQWIEEHHTRRLRSSDPSKHERGASYAGGMIVAIDLKVTLLLEHSQSDRIFHPAASASASAYQVSTSLYTAASLPRARQRCSNQTDCECQAMCIVVRGGTRTDGISVTRVGEPEGASVVDEETGFCFADMECHCAPESEHSQLGAERRQVVLELVA